MPDGVLLPFLQSNDLSLCWSQDLWELCNIGQKAGDRVNIRHTAGGRQRPGSGAADHRWAQGKQADLLRSLG